MRKSKIHMLALFCEQNRWGGTPTYFIANHWENPKYICWPSDLLFVCMWEYCLEKFGCWHGKIGMGNCSESTKWHATIYVLYLQSHNHNRTKIENTRFDVVRQFTCVLRTEERDILLINHQYMLQIRVQYLLIYS